VVQLGGEKPVTGAGIDGAGVVGDGLRIRAELVEAAVYVEVLAAARVDGIWWQRGGPEVDGVVSRFRKLRGTGAQLLAVVAGQGAPRSGLVTERCP
jgi:hypothetical protein